MTHTQAVNFRITHMLVHRVLPRCTHCSNTPWWRSSSLFPAFLFYQCINRNQVHNARNNTSCKTRPRVGNGPRHGCYGWSACIDIYASIKSCSVADITLGQEAVNISSRRMRNSSMVSRRDTMQCPDGKALQYPTPYHDHFELGRPNKVIGVCERHGSCQCVVASRTLVYWTDFGHESLISCSPIQLQEHGFNLCSRKSDSTQHIYPLEGQRAQRGLSGSIERLSCA